MRELKITHLYPELLNLYGDKGNIASLKYRAKWRGISVTVDEVLSGENADFENTDILFLGGGSGKEIKTVLEYLLPQKEKIKEYAENGGVIFAVCEGFPMLGKTFVTDGKTSSGLGILDVSFSYSEKRFTGDVAENVSIDGEEFVVTGFENRDYIVEKSEEAHFGKVISGNGEYDGAVKNNVFASCLHGPLLPKNPKLCDVLLKRALVKKYGDAELKPLEDDFENEASEVMKKRLLKG